MIVMREAHVRRHEGRLALRWAFLVAAASALQIAACDRRDPSTASLDAPLHIDLGEAPPDSEFESMIQLVNRSATEAIRIETVVSSCGCTVVDSTGFALPPLATRDFAVKVQSGSGFGRIGATVTFVLSNRSAVTTQLSMTVPMPVDPTTARWAAPGTLEVSIHPLWIDAFPSIEVLRYRDDKALRVESLPTHDRPQIAIAMQQSDLPIDLVMRSSVPLVASDDEYRYSVTIRNAMSSTPISQSQSPNSASIVTNDPVSHPASTGDDS